MKALAEKIGARLKARGALLVTAESCTGGWAAQALTSVAGSSAWFERGFVTYSNAAKEEMLGVRTDTLSRHGAVSEQTAREMALAITGVAGPTGGSAEKPVGTVCFAWARKGEPASAETRHFAGDREAVRRQSVEHALARALELLE